MTAGRRFIFGCIIAIFILLAGALPGAVAQDKPSAADLKRIRDCAAQKADEIDGGESCIFILAQPCTETPAGQSTHGKADCYRREVAAWDALLNDTYGKLRGELDDAQNRKLRDMQRVWIAARDRTCAFYDDVIRGAMAVPAASACMNRETARRALLLMRFLALAPGR